MSQLEVDKVIPQSGTTLTLGESGDTVSVPSGATLDASNATLTLPDGSVTTAKIADANVTTAKLADANITTAKLAYDPNPFRNIVINGDMSLAQRSTSVASITGNGYYTVDRFLTTLTSLGTWTQSQSTDVPTGQGFATSLKMDCTTADASPSAGDFLFIRQIFEGQNLQYLKKGTANALPLTLSFWVKSTKTGTFIAAIFDSDNNRNISKSYTINTTNTWEFKTITFAGDTTGTLNNDNGSSLYVHFWLGAGTDFTSGTLATSWESTTSANRAVGQVNLADSDTNDWYVTGVQLEAGTTASDFEFLPVDVNLARCQRYAYKISANATAIFARFCSGYNDQTTNMNGCMHFPVSMRTAPSLTTTGTAGDYGINTGTFTIFTATAVPAVNSNSANVNTANLNTSSTGMTAGQGALLLSNNNANAFLLFTAEL